MVEKNCRDCEWYELKREPGAGLLEGKKPFCVALGFFLFGNHAPECKLYRPRPGVATKRIGGEI